MSFPRCNLVVYAMSTSPVVEDAAQPGSSFVSDELSGCTKVSQPHLFQGLDVGLRGLIGEQVAGHVSGANIDKAHDGELGVLALDVEHISLESIVELSGSGHS